MKHVLMIIGSLLSLAAYAQTPAQYKVPGQNISLKNTGDSTLNAVTSMAGSSSMTSGNGLPEYFERPTLLGETTPMFAATGTFNPVSGVTYTRRMVASKSGTVTKLGFRIVLAGATLSATANDNAIAVYDSVGNRLALQSVTSLLTATGDKLVTLTTPITLVKGQPYYVSVLGTATLSVAQWAAAPASPLINHGQASAPYHWGSTATGGLVSLLVPSGESDARSFPIPWVGFFSN